MNEEERKKWEPTPIYPVWLRPEEVEEIFAVHARTGALKSVIGKIKSAQQTKGIH